MLCCASVAADRRDVGVHARTNVAIEPWFAIFGAEDNVNDDPAKGLWHCGIIAEKHAHVNRAFSADGIFFTWTWGVAPGWYEHRAVGAKQNRWEKIEVRRSVSRSTSSHVAAAPF